MENLKSILLAAPEAAFEPKLKELVETWDGEPRAIEILRLLDEAVYCGGANEGVMMVLNTCLQNRLDIEDVSYEDLLKEADWRH